MGDDEIEQETILTAEQMALELVYKNSLGLDFKGIIDLLTQNLTDDGSEVFEMYDGYSDEYLIEYLLALKSSFELRLRSYYYNTYRSVEWWEMDR